MPNKKHRLVASVLSVLFLVSLEYMIDQGAGALSEILQIFIYGSLLIAGGLVTLSICSLLGTFSDVENWVISHLLRRISEDPGRNFFAGFLLASYLNLVRPYLVDSVSFLPYMEWATLALAVYVMHTTIGLSDKEYSSENLETLGWKEHIQEVKRETGRDLKRIVAVLQEFVDYGTKEPVLVYLTSHLHRSGKTEVEILNILKPLIDYRENAGRHKLDFLAFPWTKRKVALRNKRAREALLKTLMDGFIGRDQNGFEKNKR